MGEISVAWLNPRLPGMIQINREPFRLSGPPLSYTERHYPQSLQARDSINAASLGHVFFVRFVLGEGRGLKDLAAEVNGEGG